MVYKRTLTVNNVDARKASKALDNILLSIVKKNFSPTNEKGEPIILSDEQAEKQLLMARDLAQMANGENVVTCEKTTLRSSEKSESFYRIGQYDKREERIGYAKSEKEKKWYASLIAKYPWVAQLPDEQLAKVLSSCPFTRSRVIAGTANTAHNYVISAESGAVIMANTRSATVVPFGIKDASERMRMTKENIESLINDAELQRAAEKYVKNLGLAKNKNGKIIIPILIQSLLTPSIFDLKKDSEGLMLGVKHDAINQIKKELNDPPRTIQIDGKEVDVEFEIIDTNHPVNERQAFWKGPDGYDNRDTPRLIALARNIMPAIDDNNPNKVLLQAATDQLDAAFKPNYSFGQGRRKSQIYCAAYELLVAELMGFSPINGCKSAADRQVEVVTLAEAMRIHYKSTGKLLEYKKDVLGKSSNFRQVITIQARLIQEGFHQRQFARDGNPEGRVRI